MICFFINSKAISERTQYHPVELILSSNNEVVHPMDLIHDFMRDGEEIVIKLKSFQTIDPTTGN